MGVDIKKLEISFSFSLKIYYVTYISKIGTFGKFYIVVSPD